MNPKYLPTDLPGMIDRVVEESGEIIEIIGRVLRVIGKAKRFGLTNYPPSIGGANNAAAMLSELADLRHSISTVENNVTDHAKIVVMTATGPMELHWTNELISTREIRELITDHEEGFTDEDFNDHYKKIEVCAGEWHREGLDWRFYKDPDFEA